MKQELLERTRNEVAAGVAILDQIEPNWYNRIDLDAFKMSNPNFCVMGQVFGPNDWPEVFATGPEDLGVYTPVWWSNDTHGESTAYYDAAEPFWRSAIADRRNRVASE